MSVIQPWTIGLETACTSEGGNFASALQHLDGKRSQ